MASSLTFREKQTDTCYQKVLRDKVSADESVSILFPEPPEINLKNTVIRQISRKLAWKVISRYEWLGTLPMCTHYYGIFFDDYLGGVSCIDTNMGAGMMVNKFLRIQKGEGGLISRGACVHWAPKGTAPKLINRSINLVPNIKIGLAYSDTDAGEIGTVYQASGWYYIGRGSSTQQYISPQGRVYESKILWDVRHKNNYRFNLKQIHNELIRKGWKPQKSNPKLRYAKITNYGKKDKKLVAYIESLSKPYPKRSKYASKT